MIITPSILISDASDALGELLTSNVTESADPEYSSSDTYDIGDVVKVSDAGVHRLFESLVASNTGNYPPSNTKEFLGTDAKWLAHGATNKWAMFDGKASTQTVSAVDTSITMTFRANEFVDTFALRNVEAQTVRLTMTDTTDGLVYDSGEIEMVYSPYVKDAWSYCFSKFVYRRISHKIEQLPPYKTATFSLTITPESGKQAKCGFTLVGKSDNLFESTTEFGVGLRFRSYSELDDNGYGDWTYLRRKVLDKSSFGVKVSTKFLDAIRTLVREYEGTPILWAGSTNNDAFVTFVFWLDAEWVATSPPKSDMKLTLLEMR